jgi:arsenate reductase
MTLEIYHNPRCSKSRQTLALLQDRGLEPTITHYLDAPPDATRLASVLAKLKLRPHDIMRTGEQIYRDAKDEVEAMDDAEKIAWLVANPKVLQRPIVINGDLARIGRPPESVLEILP